MSHLSQVESQLQPHFEQVQPELSRINISVFYDLNLERIVIKILIYNEQLV